MKYVVLASALLLGVLSACAPEPRAAETNVACNDSQEARCKTAPLCMLDEERACRFCRCYERLEDQIAGYGWPSTIVVSSSQAQQNPPPFPRE